MTDTPRIYVACLAAYNNGILHGRWIELDQELAAIESQVREMLSDSPIPNAEEWAIHDYDNFESIRLSEYTGLPEAKELADFVIEHGELGAELYSQLGDLKEAILYLEDQYGGEYKSLTDFAKEITEGYEICDQLRYYIDYERYARDIELSGDILSVELGHEEIHVFWAH